MNFISYFSSSVYHHVGHLLHGGRRNMKLYSDWKYFIFPHTLVEQAQTTLHQVQVFFGCCSQLTKWKSSLIPWLYDLKWNMISFTHQIWQNYIIFTWRRPLITELHKNLPMKIKVGGTAFLEHSPTAYQPGSCHFLKTDFVGFVTD